MHRLTDQESVRPSEVVQSFHLHNNEVGSEVFDCVCLPSSCAHVLMESALHYFNDPPAYYRGLNYQDTGRVSGRVGVFRTVSDDDGDGVLARLFHSKQSGSQVGRSFLSKLNGSARQLKYKEFLAFDVVLRHKTTLSRRLLAGFTVATNKEWLLNAQCVKCLFFFFLLALNGVEINV